MPAFNEWNENSSSISQAESEVGLMQSQRDGFLQAKNMYPQLEQIDASLRTRFPEIADNDGLISQLSIALASSGIGSSSLTLTFSPPEILAPTFTEAPLPEVVDESADAGEEMPIEDPAAMPVDMNGGESLSDMAKMDIAIAVEGDDQQIVQFLNVLHSADRAIVVKKFSVQKNIETQVNQLAITAEVYIFSRIPNPGDTAVDLIEGEEQVSDGFGGEATG